MTESSTTDCVFPDIDTGEVETMQTVPPRPRGDVRLAAQKSDITAERARPEALDNMPTLPPKGARAERLARDASADQSARRVLVIDDNRLARTFLQRTLEDQGWRVQTANSFDDAMHSVLAFEPEVVVCDVKMPDVQGDALCRVIKTRRGARVVLYSALAPSELELCARSAGADAWACKDSGTAALLSTIRSLL